MSKALLVEWQAHQSAFAVRWRAAMVASRRLRIADVSEDVRLRAKLADALPKESERKALLKDTHLLEAALGFDDRIVSSDHISRKLAARTSSTVREIAAVQWADAVDWPDETCEWIAGGARDPYAFRLVDQPMEHHRRATGT
jgi:hypothetical protein